ncbi:response regulator transcription factor [Puniceicoccus vermicola]|uniref:Response regulator transcription factor n=1 Tax=Puniceicoccus vermicola TaxID=388746 RepID=A0A7X1AXC0_9BACT|nr:response regulator transcription factor [Puniceicoccus vermicola]MBC2601634.1 response regulator transcription factor [Puniceicoccus vermicola]
MIDAPNTPVLLVEDNFDLAGNIQDYLEQRGWSVDYVPNGALALHRVTEQTHAAVILDLRLPVIDGLEVCRRLRNSIAPRIPVLMLTAADLLDDRLTGFAAGADDYMVKPFALPELFARLRALLRRSSALPSTSVLRLHDLELNSSTREVYRGDRRLILTRMGYSILQCLLARSPAVVPRQELERHLWADDPPGSDAMRTHIATLRAEVDRGERTALLHTHRGIGYQMAVIDPAHRHE